MAPIGFRDRRDAGRRLAALLQPLAKQEELLILALPRGGVPVAAEVAAVLGKSFDVLVVRKLGVPRHEEYAMGAIASGGVFVLNEKVVSRLGLKQADVTAVVERESRELARRESLYRGSRGAPDIAGHPVVVIDDGIATGSTMSAAIRLLRKQRAARVVVAVPVAPRDTIRRLREEADEVIVALDPEDFSAVGEWYEDFSQTSDEEVRLLLDNRSAPKATGDT